MRRRGWDFYFVAGDAYGTATAVRLAIEDPEPVLGLALGHASLDYNSAGEQPSYRRCGGPRTSQIGRYVNVGL